MSNSPTIPAVYFSVIPSFPKYSFWKVLHSGFINQVSKDVIPF